jgi:hypothetical protein
VAGKIFINHRRLLSETHAEVLFLHLRTDAQVYVKWLSSVTVQSYRLMADIPPFWWCG